MKPGEGAIEYQDVRLRLLQEADLPITLLWRNREGVRQNFIHSDQLTLESHRNWFLKYIEKNNDLVFIVEDKKSGDSVGQVAIYDIDQGSARAEIGRFIVAPEHSGQGRMRVAIAALIEFASLKLHLHVLTLDVFATNVRAIKLYEGLGFKRKSCSEGLINMEREINDDAHQ